MKTFLRIVSYVLAVVLANCLTLAALKPNQTTGADKPGKLDELQSIIEQRFVGEVDAEDLLDGAAEGMVDALQDRWSYYIPAKQYMSYREQMQNAYVGIGVTVSARDDGTGFDILEVNPGGSAVEAGLLPGDILIRVDGLDAVALGMDGVTNAIRGEPGTMVAITVNRDGEELTFDVERREIRVTVASGTLLDGDVGLVTITNFDERCADETIAAIEMLIGQGATSLLFDVRYNPGGYKSELVEVLDYLLPEGPLFRSQYYDGREELDSSGESCLDIPMAVLVNGSSYSAAEFFAAAIREYDAGFVVGTQTCGKGYFQNTFRLSDGSAVGLSIGKYFTPNGVCLAEVGGLTPDVVVEVDSDTASLIYAGTLDPAEDPQIQAAVEKLTANSGE